MSLLQIINLLSSSGIGSRLFLIWKAYDASGVMGAIILTMLSTSGSLVCSSRGRRPRGADR
eukprot:3562183-Pyramimonas_sp.AAC.1